MKNQEEPEDFRKQLLCKEEIIDKGYNAETFESFMLSQKENGDNIDSWTMSELQSIILAFQKTHLTIDDESNLNSQLNQSMPQFVQKQQNLPLVRKESIHDEQYPLQLKADFIITSQNKFVECNKQQQWIVEDVVVKVSDPVLNTRGFFDIFSSPSIKFNIYTMPYKIYVKRSVQDFFTLRDILKKQYPEKIVPAIPNEMKIDELQQKVLTDKNIKNQFCQYLEIFINEVTQREEFTRNNYVQMFLKEIKFVVTVEKDQKVFKSISLQDKYSKDGILNLSIDNEIINQIRIFEDFIDKCLPCHKQMNDDLKAIGGKFEEISQMIVQLATKMSSVSNLSFQNDPFASIKNIYTSASSYIASWGCAIQEQNKDMIKTLGQYFTKIKIDSMSLIEIRENMEVCLNNYYEKNKSLTKKKDYLFQTKDTNLWQIKKQHQFKQEELFKDPTIAYKIMCSEDNMNQEQLKDGYCYFIQSVSEQMQQYAKKLSIKCEQTFIEFGTLQMSAQFEVLNGWKNMVNEYSSNLP